MSELGWQVFWGLGLICVVVQIALFFSQIAYRRLRGQPIHFKTLSVVESYLLPVLLLADELANIRADIKNRHRRKRGQSVASDFKHYFLSGHEFGVSDVKQEDYRGLGWQFIENKLAVLAVAFQKAIIAQEEARRVRSRRLHVADLKVEWTKSDFWAAHAAAKYYGYSVFPKWGDYLSKGTIPTRTRGQRAVYFMPT